MRQPERSRPGGSAASGVEAPGDCARLVLGEASHAHPLGYPPRLAGARSRGARLDHRGRECPVTSSGKKLPLLSLGPLGAGVPTHVCRLRSPWPLLLLAPPCTPRRPPRSSPHRLCTPPAGVSAPACRSCRPGTRQAPMDSLCREDRLWQTLHCGRDAFPLTPAFQIRPQVRTERAQKLGA